METTLDFSPAVYTMNRDHQCFLDALKSGRRCEIDEALFIHWIEAARPVCMGRQVVLDDKRPVRADYVTCIDGTRSLLAFWHRTETCNPMDRRYFAQRALRVI